jgi:uncharacterized RDD family membrane protein YckC
VAAYYSAGFWRRSVAFIVDVLLLGIVGALVGWMLFDVFARMGGYGRLLGFAVALSYFGVMNSALCGGQTLGKRLLGVRVVGKDGALLPLPQSLLRYSVLGIPFFLNGAPFDSSVVLSPLGYVLSLLVFGGMFSILYLYVFNRKGRRSLHDLAVGSTVVAHNAPLGSVRPAPVWRVHFVVVAVLLVAATIVPFFTNRLAQSDTFKDMLAAYAAVVAEPGVQSAQITRNTIYRSGSPNDEVVVARVQLRQSRTDDGALAEHIAKLIVTKDPKARTVSVISVQLVYGYDLGIAHGSRSHNYRFTPESLGSAGDALP